MSASLLDMEVMIDGTPLYKELREERPVYFDEDMKMWVVSRYHDVAEVFRQPNLFSNALALFASYRFEDVVTEILNTKGHGVIQRVLPMTDPPEHTRVRAMVNLAFSVRRVAKIQDYIEKLTTELIDSFIDDGHAEVVSQIAVPLPVTVIGDLLCVPRDRGNDIKNWTWSYSACAGNRIASHEEAVRVGNDLAAMQNFLAGHIAQRRETPGDDTMTDLLNARSGSFEPLSDGEIMGIAVAFLGAGHETSTVSITHIFKVLAQNPQILEYLRNAPDHDAAVRNFCEELLRMEPPLNALPRVTTAEAQVGGVTIPAFNPVLVIGASGNRDKAMFGDDSEQFNPGRVGANRHLTFGGGVHQCLGNMLARAELRCVTSAIVKRMDNIKLVTPVPPLSDYHAVIMPFNYRLNKLEITFDKLA